MSDGLTLVLEFNCYEKGGIKATVWMFPRRVTKILGETDDDISKFPGARRIIGPVETRIAETVFNQIQETLREAQIPFESTDAADD